MEAPTIEALTTVGGIALLVVAIQAVLMPALRLSPEASDRFGPLIAAGLGITVGVVAIMVLGIARPDTLLTAVIAGLFGGLQAIGIHQVGKHSIAGAGKEATRTTDGT